MHALLVTYRLEAATPTEHAELCEQIAPAIAAVPGLVSMTWLCNADGGRYGGFCVFDDRQSFDAFVASELFGLLAARTHMSDLAASDFAVCESPTQLTRGPT